LIQLLGKKSGGGRGSKTKGVEEISHLRSLEAISEKLLAYK
jgi:hypothetical protein